MSRRLLTSMVVTMILASWIPVSRAGDPVADLGQAFRSGSISALSAYLPDDGKVSIVVSGAIPARSGYYSSGQTRSILRDLFKQVRPLACRLSGTPSDQPRLARGVWRFARRDTGAEVEASLTITLTPVGKRLALREIRIQER